MEDNVNGLVKGNDNIFKSNDIKYDRAYSINTKTTKSFNSENETVYKYEAVKLINHRLMVTESFIRKIIFAVGILVGIVFSAIIKFVQNIDFTKYIIFAKNTINVILAFFYSFVLFSNNMLKDTRFRYVFNISIVLTIIAVILFACIYYEESCNIFSSIFFTFLFFLIYLNANFIVCHIIIKISFWFKVLSFLAILLSNFVIFCLLLCVAIWFFDW